MGECRICLVKNVRMHSVYQTWYQEMYEKLSGNKLRRENGGPGTVCYICNSQLHKFSKFFKMSQNSEKILTLRLLNSIEMPESPDRISIHNLSMTAVQSMSFIDDGKEEEPEVTVTIKEEPLEFEDDAEMFKEEYLDSPSSEETQHNVEPHIESPQCRLNPLNIPNKPDSPVPEWPTLPKLEINPNEIKKETTLNSENLGLAQALQDLSAILENMPLETPDNFYPKSRKNEASYFCSLCNYRCRTARTLKHHSQVHDPNNNYACEFCLYRFTDEKKLAKHKIFCTVCSICGKKFSNISGLRIHIRLHTGDHPYSCNTCGKNFNQKTNLRTHLRVHDRDMQYPCTVCNKSFPFRSFLERHMLIHADTPLEYERLQRIVNCHKLFAPKKKKTINICSVCGKILCSKEGLNMHMRLHTGAQPFSCEVCQKVFNQKCNLLTHVERVHAGHELFSCYVCHRMFPFNSELKKHLVTHIGKVSEREFDIFQQKNIYMLHRKVDTGETTPYPCDMCFKILSY